MKKRDTLKQELLNKYAEKEPKAFYQYDGFLHMADSTCDSGDDDAIYGPSVTHELMWGSSVRVLITPGTKDEDILRLLKKIRGYVKKSGLARAGEELASKDARLDAELCPRCGEPMQATHSPLCRGNDGTQTELTDEEVRKAVAVLGYRAHGLVRDAEEIPF